MEQELFKAIFKIEGDSTSAIKALEDINKKYEESSDLLKDQTRELKKLEKQEADLLAARSKANNATQAAIYNRKLEETAQAINKIKGYMEQTSASTKKLKTESDSLNTSLKQAFDGTRITAAKTEIEKVTASSKSLRAQLKDLKQQLASTNDDEEFLRLSVQAGQLQDKLDDAAQAARAFATGSPLQAFGNSLRGVASDLLNLDFDGAAQKSKLLAEASSRITFKGGLEGVKQLGTTLLNVGKSLLSNPIFLIGTAVALIIANFDKLKESGGLIGNLFKVISKTVQDLGDAFIWLSDAIGLTNTKAAEFARNRDAQISKEIKGLEKQAQATVDAFNLKIRLLQAEGKETFTLEAQRNAFAAKAARDRINILSNNLSKEEELRAEQKKQISDLFILEKRLIEDNFVLTAANNKKKLDAAIKANEEEKELFEKTYKDLSKLEDDRLERKSKALEEEKKLFEKTYDELSKAEDERLDKKAKDAEEERKLYEETWEQLKKGQDDVLENERKIKEQEDALRAQKLQSDIEGINTVTNAAINGAQAVTAAQQKQVDTLINLQSKRVEETRAIADKGNAELLELEQKRLDDLNAKRERFVRQQQTLALIELTANSTIAIAKAAAQGGAAAPFTIAATLLALGAGFIQARTLAASQGFYKGGYTGDGDPHGESTAIGAKPYTYHKGEFVFDHQKTRKYRDIFDGIHKGNIDLSEWRSKVSAFESMRYQPGEVNIDIESLQSEVKMLRKTIENQSTSINFDEHGLNARFQNIKVRQAWLEKLAK